LKESPYWILKKNPALKTGKQQSRSANPCL